MYNYYESNSGGFLLTIDYQEKELVLFIANFLDKEYFNEEERSRGLYGDKKPMICNNVLEEFDIFEKINKNEFVNLFYKWFIIHGGVSSEKAPYIKSSMIIWSIYS